LKRKNASHFLVLRRRPASPAAARGLVGPRPPRPARRHARWAAARRGAARRASQNPVSVDWSDGVENRPASTSTEQLLMRGRGCRRAAARCLPAPRRAASSVVQATAPPPNPQLSGSRIRGFRRTPLPRAPSAPDPRGHNPDPRGHNPDPRGHNATLRRLTPARALPEMHRRPCVADDRRLPRLAFAGLVSAFAVPALAVTTPTLAVTSPRCAGSRRRAYFQKCIGDTRSPMIVAFLRLRALALRRARTRQARACRSWYARALSLESLSGARAFIASRAYV